MKSVLITGASGFVGRFLAAELGERGFSVTAHSLSRGDPPSAPIEQVIHLSARSFVPDSWKSPAEFYEVNVRGTERILEFCRNCGASLIFVSSYVYGRPDSLPIGESHPLQAMNPYAQTKILAEELCRFYSISYALPLTIVRPFNLYGPGQAAHFLIPTLIAQAVSPESEIVVDDETPRRDFLFVTDFVDLLARMAEQPRPGVYNAGSGCSASVSEIVAIINTLIPAPKKLRARGARRPNEIEDVVADIRKARETFQWQPRVSLRQGLEQMLSL